ncbi:MAG: T9SS type A sorting domain-containing protein [Bacteroidia bacterium]
MWGAFTCIVGYSITTNLNDIELKKINITIFPNPVNDILHINYNSNKIGDTKFEIINSSGETVFKLDNLNKRNEIDVNFLPNGIYYLRVIGIVEQKKFTILKL